MAIENPVLVTDNDMIVRGDMQIDGTLTVGSGVTMAGTAVTTTAVELNILHGVTAATAELNILDNATVTTAELNTIDLSAVGALVKVKKIHVAAGDWTAETDTTVDLPAKSVVLDVFLDVTTLQAGKTVSVGTLSTEAGGDANGFIAGASLATAGLVRPGVVLGAGFYDTTLRGELLRQFVQGTNADDRGLYTETPYLSTAATAKSVSYSTGEVVTAVFDIYIVYIELG